MVERAAQGRAVTFAGWDGGEWGTLDTEEAGRREAQMFTANNMVRTRAGLLSPRPGVKELAVTGLPAGTVRGFGYAGTLGSDLWIIVGTGVYLLDGLAGGAATLLGQIAVTPNRPVQGVESGVGITHITVSGDKCYRINHITKTLTALAGSPGGDSIELWGERLAVGGRDTARVFYSEPANFAAWPALNFFDVGARAAVRALFAQRGHLTIALADGSWWVRTGTPGHSGELRRVSGGGVHPWHFTAQAAVMLGGDQIAYVPVSSDYPALFNGAVPREERHLGLIGALGSGYIDGFVDIKAVRGFRPDEWVYVLPNQNRLAQFRHGVWTHHTLPAAISSPYVASNAQGLIYLCDGGGGSTPRVFTYQLNVERPGSVLDTFARPGDNSNTPLDASFRLPQWWHPDGHEVRVRGVIVDFETHTSGSATANRFDVTAVAMRSYGTPGEVGANTQTWTRTPAALNRERVHLGFGDQGRGGGFELRFTNVRGVSIRSVVAVIDIWERRL
jgi:hypothetical protein